jgi:hypothetical protein
MKSASSRGLNTSGAVSFELMLIFMTFFTIFLAVCDLARFWVTTNSVRTLASELVRQTLIYCANQSQTTACALPSTGTNSVATAEASVPFLLTSGFASTPSASRAAMNASTGVMAITASASYSFSFMLPVWRGTITQVAQNTQLGY